MAKNSNYEDVPNQYTIGTISNQITTKAQLFKIKDFEGHFEVMPPETIQPQEIGTEFKHANRVPKVSRDAGAVVYRSKNAAGIEYDWVFAWYNSFVDSVQKNAVYTDIIPSDKAIYDDQYWAKVETELKSNPPKVIVIKYGYMSVATINNELPARFNGTMVYTDIIPSDKAIYDDQYWAKVETELKSNPPKVIVIKYGYMSVATINNELPARFNGTMVTLN